MKKIIALLLACALALTGCKADNGGNAIRQTNGTTTATSIINTTTEASTALPNVSDLTEVSATTVDDITIADETAIPDFSGINDPEFIQYLNDQVYSDLEVTFGQLTNACCQI